MTGSPTIIKDVAEFKQRFDQLSGASLKEDIFVNVFLPVFSGEDSLYGVTLKDWTERFGAFTSVDIVDSVGKVLFTVPPFMDNGVLRPRKEGEERIIDIVEGARMRSMIHPVQGENFIRSKLDETVNRLTIKESAKEHIAVWNSIFARYNKPLPFPEEKTQVSSGNSLESLPILGYDPL